MALEIKKVIDISKWLKLIVGTTWDNGSEKAFKALN